MKLEVEKQGLTKEQLLQAAYKDMQYIASKIDCLSYEYNNSFTKHDAHKFLKLFEYLDIITDKLVKAEFKYNDDARRAGLLSVLTVINNTCFYAKKEVESLIRKQEAVLIEANEEIKKFKARVKHAKKVEEVFSESAKNVKRLVDIYTVREWGSD